MASHVPKPVNINRADEAELKSLPQIGRFQAQAIIAALMPSLLDPQPQSLQPDVNPSQCPLPAPEDIQNQMESSVDTAVGPPTQSTPVHIAQAHFKFQP